MRSEGRVRHKLAQVQFRHLKDAVRKGLSVRPENCNHNGVLEGAPDRVHLCLLPPDLTDAAGKVVTCDARYGGLERARGCPDYSCRHTKDRLKGEFMEFLRTAPLADVAHRYPDIAALRWVLDQGVEDVVEPTVSLVSPPQVDPVPAPTSVRVPLAGPPVYRVPAFPWAHRSGVALSLDTEGYGVLS